MINSNSAQKMVDKDSLSKLLPNFQTLLTSETDDRAPIIYLRDVAFSELECLLQFIYSGRTSVPGKDLASFLGLARSLGVSGFTAEGGEQGSPPGKRKMEEGLLKHTVSEPAYLGGKPGRLFNAVVWFHTG